MQRLQYTELHPHIAFLSIGSNLGNPRENCIKAIRDMNISGFCIVTAQSPFYKTEPVDFIDQGWFVNAALKIRTMLEPLDLLKKLKSLETNAGRPDKNIRFGPRVLDLDIIFYDQMIMTSSDLTLPHPRMHKRRFVLKPVCDIDPWMRHPVLKESMLSLIINLRDEEQKVIYDP